MSVLCADALPFLACHPADKLGGRLLHRGALPHHHGLGVTFPRLFSHHLHGIAGGIQGIRVLLVYHQRRHVPLKAVALGLPGKGFNVGGIVHQHGHLAGKPVVLSGSVVKGNGVGRNAQAAHVFDNAVLGSAQPQIPGKGIPHRGQSLQRAVLRGRLHRGPDAHLLPVHGVSALLVGLHHLSRRHVKLVVKFQGFPLAVALSRPFSRVAALRGHDVVRRGIQKREVPVAVSGQILQAVAAHAPAVVKPPLREHSVLGAEIFARIGVVHGKDHCQILHLVPVHGNPVVEHRDLVVCRKRPVVAAHIGRAAAVVAFLRHGDARQLREIRLVLAAAVRDLPGVPRVHILLVHADDPDSRLLKQGLVIIDGGGLGIQGQTVQRVRLVGRIVRHVQPQSVYGIFKDIRCVNVRHRVKVRSHIRHKAHVDPSLEVVLDHQKHVIALLCRRHGCNITGVAGDGYGRVLHIDIVLLAVGFVKLVHHGLVHAELRIVPIGTEDDLRLLSAARSASVRPVSAAGRQRKDKQQAQNNARNFPAFPHNVSLPYFFRLSFTPCLLPKLPGR